MSAAPVPPPIMPVTAPIAVSLPTSPQSTRPVVAFWDATEMPPLIRAPDAPSSASLNTTHPGEHQRDPAHDRRARDDVLPVVLRPLTADEMPPGSHPGTPAGPRPSPAAARAGRRACSGSLPAYEYGFPDHAAPGSARAGPPTGSPGPPGRTPGPRATPARRRTAPPEPVSATPAAGSPTGRSDGERAQPTGRPRRSPEHRASPAASQHRRSRVTPARQVEDSDVSPTADERRHDRRRCPTRSRPRRPRRARRARRPRRRCAPVSAYEASRSTTPAR